MYMKIIDKFIKLILGIGLMITLSIGGLMVYILALFMALYRGIRNQIDFIKEFEELNSIFIKSIKEYIFSGEV